MIIKVPAISNIITTALVVILLSYSSIATISINYIIQPAHAQTFSNPVNLTNGPGDQTDPHIAASGTNSYLVMTHNEAGASSILFSRSVDGGISYSTPIQLPRVSELSFSFLPSVAASGNNVYVSWTDVTDQLKIFLITSTDGGLNFGSPVEVTTSAQLDARSSEVAAYGNNVYVTWQDLSTSTSGLDPEIFFAVSTDGGLSFSNPISLSSNLGTLNSTLNDIAVSGNNVYTTWTTLLNGSNDIFFASGTLQAVLIPAQAIQQLIDLAQSIGINTGPLHQAVDLISDTNPNNDRAVCNQLDAFINQVNTNLQQQQGQIIPEQANQLIQSAQSIKATIGCR
jgi:hypothetical protein